MEPLYNYNPFHTSVQSHPIGRDASEKKTSRLNDRRSLLRPFAAGVPMLFDNRTLEGGCKGVERAQNGQHMSFLTQTTIVDDHWTGTLDEVRLVGLD